jgi:uncharacterized membrane protein YidH (DUF202 family)
VAFVILILVATCTVLVGERKQERTEKQLKEGPRHPSLFLVVSVVSIIPTVVVVFVVVVHGAERGSVCEPPP